ncbi:transglutaminase domain-containing protein [Bacillus spongiae]|uniref:Transglutaminase domain-containing protein n=1 Tax=Bacillus spongiae TaxID=2683610 RepID=A0ABU8HJA5_9BACI
MNEYVQKNWKQVVFLFIGFVFIGEWLRPLEVVTDTGDIFYFLVFVLVSFVLLYFHINRWLSYTIKLLIILFSINRIHFDIPIIQFEWVGMFLNDIIVGTGRLVSQEWMLLPNPFRTILFFTLLWIMTYLVHYWLNVKKSMFLFFILTLVYITVLDTFTEYDAKISMVRTIILGFLLLGILAFEKLAVKENIQASAQVFQRWIIPLVVIVSITSLFAYAAPKAEQPKWPDPVPFFKSLNPNSGSGLGGVKKAGYGEDDSQLGGPYIGDATIVYETEVQEKHYWKIETKEYYTGKGWITKTDQTNTQELEDGISPLPPDPTKPSVTESVRGLTNFYPHVAYPYGFERVTFDSKPNYQVDYHPYTEKLRPLAKGEPVSITNYTVQYRKPVYRIDKMENITSIEDVNDMEELSESEVIEAKSIYEVYTQLPALLPDRVKELAEEITEESSNWYEMTKEVEQYFDNNGFVYEETDVLTPGDEEDYVDQFLFESQQGYCDNFSSSMVVLLRSVGVPARWVKGFTGGEFVKNLEEGKSQFNVTNNNAHSWVEVYFPGVGWVPFEPTIGFDNNVSYQKITETRNIDSEDTATEASAPVDQQDVQRNQILPDEDVGGEESVTDETVVTKIKNYILNNWFKLFVLLTVVSGTIVYIFVKRSRWIPYLLLIRYKFRKQDLSKAYIALLKQFERFGLKMEEGQTLREYAHYIDSFFGTREMTTLTREYEKQLYGNSEEANWIEMRELWENLIKRTTG